MSKRLAVVIMVLAVITVLSIGEAFATDFTFSGEARLRPEYRDNTDFSSAATAGDNQNYYGQRLRLGVDAKISETLKGFIQIQDTRYWGTDNIYTADAPGDAEALDLHQAYVELANVGGMPLTLKVGRQLLIYGEHRLVGNLDWSNNARAFDAIKATYKMDAATIDFWTAKITESSITAASPSPTVVANSADNDIDLYGIYSMIKSVPNVPIDVYLLYRRNGATAANENRYTLGGRAEAKPIEGLDLMGELAYQTGDASTTVDASAYAFALRAGYAIPGAWSPKVSIEYDYATGDDGTDPNEDNTFSQLYPTWHRNLGYGDYVAWQNISAIKLGVTAKPTDKCHASIDYWLFSLAESADDFYLASTGALTGSNAFRDNTAANTEDSLGNELDIIFRHTFNPNLNVEIGLARFFAGDFMEQASKLGTNAEDSDWAYLMATVNF